MGYPLEGSRAPAAAPPVLARRLGRRFGRRWALALVDLTVEAGESLLLAGPNGSGKTTLLRLVAGLHRPSAGELSVFGHHPRYQRLSCRRRLSLVSHHSYLYDRLTALETLRTWAALLGRREGTGALRELLAEVGLEERRDSLVGGFSAGMRKRLSLLRTRLEEPDLVLLDEPFSALDVAGQRLVEAWIGDFRRRGLTIVIASHDLARAAALCDRAVLLRSGQVAWRGEVAEAPARLEEISG